MSLSIPTGILALKGQKINTIEFNSESKKVLIQYQRDKRKSAIDSLTERKGSINRLVRRQAREYANFWSSLLDRNKISASVISVKMNAEWDRVILLIQGVILPIDRYMSIEAVSKHFLLLSNMISYH